MHASIPLSVLALAASALAAPVVVYETKVVTVMYTEGATQPTAPVQAPAQGYKQHNPKPSPEVVVTRSEAPVVPTSTVVYAPVLPPSSSVAPTSAAAPVSTSTPSTGYMGVVDEWRTKLGLTKINQDAKMEANILDCLQSKPGDMEHKLNPGTFGQVLAFGKMSDFEHVFVGGWLCEVPSTPGLGNDVCAQQSKGFTYTGDDGKEQVGHNKLLVDPKFTKIGCAEFQGVVGCDLSYGNY